MEQLDTLIVQSIIRSMPVGLLVIDPQGNITVGNEALEDILGYSISELKTKGWGEVFFAFQENVAFNQVIIDVVFHEMVDLRREVPYKHPTKGKRRLSVTSSFLSMNGEMIGVQLIFADITEKHRLYKREREMLRTMNRLQQERTEGLNKLALSVAHQIRNPMMVIGGFSNRLLQEATKPEDTQRLEVIMDELYRLERVVRAVERYAGMPKLQSNVVDLEQWLQANCNQLFSFLDACPPACLDLAVESCTVHADPGLLNNALVELLRNAVEAPGDEPRVISLSCERAGEKAVVCVRDNGSGISEENLPYVFDPFFTTKTHSVGIGLCLAERIILDHHGEIKVDSAPGQGASFTILLPLLAEE